MHLEPRRDLTRPRVDSQRRTTVIASRGARLVRQPRTPLERQDGEDGNGSTREITLPLPSTHTPADMSTGSIFFIGTATVLIRYAGLTVLTDPNFIHSTSRDLVRVVCHPPDGSRA